jgi:hypothetical protein
MYVFYKHHVTFQSLEVVGRAQIFYIQGQFVL